MKPRSSVGDWYTIQSMDDGVSLISEHHIKAFYRCNIWHVMGRDWNLLVDSGMGVVDLAPWVTDLSDRQTLAVASHTHFDHIGGHFEFEHRLVHRCEADILENPNRENTLADPYVTDEIFDCLPPLPYRSREYRVKGAGATRVLEDGDVIDLGNRRFQVMHTPGHSPGSVMLWEQATRILFSGDTVYDGPLVDDAYHSDSEDYLTTMEKILALPVRVVHGGHFPSFDGGRYLQLIRAYLESCATRG